MNSLVRFSPSHEVRRLQRELDSVFSDFFTPARNGEGEAQQWTPRVDVRETENDYTIQVDVPGVHKENLNIDYHDGMLAISGERKAEERQEGENMVRVERMYGSFYRQFALPKAVEAEHIEATCRDGVLSVRVPKAEESKPRRIAVQ